jgi:hypothetical protein
MKTLATLVQIAALSACFATYAIAAGSIEMPGMRRAMQTIAAAERPLTASLVASSTAVAD